MVLISIVDLVEVKLVNIRATATLNEIKPTQNQGHIHERYMKLRPHEIKVAH